MSADMLAMDGGRWRQEPAPRTILEAPQMWRDFADSEEARGNQDLADSYRRLAETVERFTVMPGGRL